MHQRRFLGLSEAWESVRAMMQAAEERPGRPVAVAVVDPRGDLIAFAAEGEVNTALARQNAFKKAFTAACMRTHTTEFGERAQETGMSVANYGQPDFTGGAGGMVVTDSETGLVLAGLGVSGRTGEEDQEIVEIGYRVVLEALGAS